MTAKAISGTVTSHTVIRVPGKANASNAPFVLLLVRRSDGASVLGHFAGGEPPPIGARVIADGPEATPLFRQEERS